MDQVGPRFPDMTEAYDKTFGEIAKKCAARKGIKLQEGVYVGLQGPTYETPAEVRYLQFIGGNAVGMSTVPEVIAANHMGVRVCGISCLTNLAAGITGDKLSHEEVQATGRKVEDTFKEFLVDLIPGIAEHLSHESSK